MHKDQVLILRIDKSLSERLAERKEKTDVPTAVFVRKCIERGLNPTGCEKILEKELAGKP
jgi:predicted DNA-binding protein